ncbi:Tigger transposable element-derived protein 1-like [Oopsacas minuta]|uniref:Tigger transposable element-derived protein 1-like n=1 Tax=Oopsacas minuta TaxID=111878 RepID=A0AAV7JBW4_9METZ|nr:Tigger transposable element-derived protein 1-like [Oopsacas minuta]
MPQKTYISREEKTMPGFKAAKDRLTLMLGGNTSEDFQLKPLLVYRAENPRAFKNITKSSLPVIWKSNTKAWVTLVVFEDWISTRRGQEILENLVEIFKKLDIDLDEEDFEELSESHSLELTNEELMELEAMQRQSEQENEEEILPIKKFET